MTDKLIRQAATEQAEAAETPPLLMVLVDLIKQNLWLLEYGSERPLDFVNPAVVAAREIGVLCLRCAQESDATLAEMLARHTPADRAA